MLTSTLANIDLEALTHNLSVIKKISPQSKILAMVKANAYGHGALKVAARIEKEVDAFGVVFLQEGLSLHVAGIKKPIVITTGFFDAEELQIIDECGLEVVVHNFEQIKILESYKPKRLLRIWLKIDSGMHRLGFQPHQVAKAYEMLMAQKMLAKPLRFTTHFSDADNISSDKTNLQMTRFRNAIDGLDGETCLANSAAILNWPETRSTWIRPGIMLYGVYPFDRKMANKLGLKPVMTLSSNIIAIHELDKGESVGYGSTFKCPEKMRVGTISTGYGDGYPRNAINAPVLVDGMRTKILGTVAMDMMAIDLRKVPDAKVGSKVILWGRGLSIDEIAACCGEIQYELFCRLTSRVKY